MRRKSFLALLLAFLVISSVTVSAQADSSLVLESGRMSDDFDDGNVNGYDLGGDLVQAETTHALSESYSANVTMDDLGELEAETNESFTFDTNSSMTMNYSFYRDWNNQTTNFAGEVSYIQLQENKSSPETLRLAYDIDDPTNNDDAKIRISGDMVEDAVSSGDTYLPNGKWHTLRVDIDRSEDVNNVSVFLNGTEVVTTNATEGFPSNEVTAEFGMDPFAGDITGANRVWFDDVEMNQTSFVDITLDVEEYMKHGTNQKYTVELGNGTDVTDASTVTSSDEDIIFVSGSTNELQATSDVSKNAEVEITASYKGNTDTKNVTVANMTAENADIMPTGITMGVALIGNAINPVSGDRPGGTQLTMQIIIVATLAAVAVSRAAGSYAGIGTIVLVMAAGWFMGWVGDGVMLVTIYIGLFIGLNVAANAGVTLPRRG